MYLTNPLLFVFWVDYSFLTSMTMNNPEDIFADSRKKRGRL